MTRVVVMVIYSRDRKEPQMSSDVLPVSTINIARQFSVYISIILGLSLSVRGRGEPFDLDISQGG